MIKHKPLLLMRKFSPYILLALELISFSPYVYSQSVDPLTGRLEISIPLGKLEANDISIPISIYHKGTSLTMAESEGELGLGWGLSNYSITREMRGIPDEFNNAFRKGWLYNNNAATIQNFTPVGDDNLDVCTDEVADFNFFQTHLGADYVNDTEPDIFSINVPGISAKFVFDATGAPRLLTHRNITIIPHLPYGGFTVKTDNGLVYTFGNKDSDEHLSSKKPDIIAEEHTQYRYNRFLGNYPPSYGEFSYPVEWGITSIYSQTTNTTATFTYNAADLWTRGLGRTYHTVDSTYFTNNTYWRGYLASITLKSYTATFTWKDDLLRKVKIEESATQDKQEVSFQYAKSGSNASLNHNLKYFLQGLSFEAGPCKPSEMYTFEYEGVIIDHRFSGANLPAYIDWKRHWGIDYFGFVEGGTTNKNIPQLFFYSAENDSRRLRTWFISGLSGGVPTIGNGRVPNLNASFGALKKVSYPAGGFTSVEYGPNEYVDSSVGETFFGPGVRVKKIISQGGEAAFGKSLTDVSAYRAIVKEYEYTNAGNTSSSGLLLSPAKLGYITRDHIRQTANNLGEEPIVFYTRVKEKIPGQGYTLYEFNVPGTFPETVNGDWKATKSRIARGPGANCARGNLKNGFYLYPYPPSTNYDFRRGLVSKVSVYSETNALVREQSTSYTTLAKNPGVVKGIRFENISGVYYYGIYELLTGRVDVPLTQVVKEASLEDPTKLLQTTTTFAYNSNSLLRSVTTALPNNTTTLKEFRYASDFMFTTPVATDTAAVALKALNDQLRGAELVEESRYITLPGNVKTVTGSELTIYRNFGNGLVLPYYLRWLPSGSTLTPAAISANNFVPDSDYRTSKTLKEYDSEARPLTVWDDKRNVASTHYAQGTSFPVATFMQASAQQCVFEGFEMPSSFGLSINGSDFLYTNGWTGEKALTLTNATTTLLSSASTLVQKSDIGTYRVSCWVYGASGKTITFRSKLGSNVLSSITLVNTIASQWNYLEGVLTTTSFNGPFQLEVVTNATAADPVTLDDIVAIPTQARVSLQTVLPLKGITSTTDDNGHSTKQTYDDMGRPMATYDQDRNLVQKNEYVIKNAVTPLPYADFILNPIVGPYFIETPYIFTPYTDPCNPSLKYSWEVDGKAVPSNQDNSLTYLFVTTGQHTVKLTTNTIDNVSNSKSVSFCVEYLPWQFYIELNDQNGTPINTSGCISASQIINRKLIAPVGFPKDCSVDVSWLLTSEPNDKGEIFSTYTAVYTVSCSYIENCSNNSPAWNTGETSITFQNCQ
jgi:YD repeat-containing protein